MAITDLSAVRPDCPFCESPKGDPRKVACNTCWKSLSKVAKRLWYQEGLSRIINGQARSWYAYARAWDAAQRALQ